MLFTDLLFFGIKLSFLCLKQASFLDLIASSPAGLFLFFTSIAAFFFFFFSSSSFFALFCLSKLWFRMGASLH
jgi:hypothetical protein